LRGAPALIALDWGTSNLRARLLGAEGRELEGRSALGGIMAVPQGGFECVLRELCADWIDGLGVPLMASGMIGSRQGWVEAPYLPCPAALPEVASRLTRVSLKGGAVLHIVPGLSCVGLDGVTDVMRGEETQLWGAGLSEGEVAVLPGTHSKWAWMGEGARVERFRTYMTGELYALATQHSILGRLMVSGHESPEDFLSGVRLGLAEHAHATHALFAARTAGLTGQVSAQGLPDYLSGLLIGLEMGSARAAGALPRDGVTLIGEESLCSRYARALNCAGVASTLAAGEVTTRGQWRVAQASGLLKLARQEVEGR
jgi:2-dehydro-3-deoxygalactonokinase